MSTRVRWKRPDRGGLSKINLPLMYRAAEGVLCCAGSSMVEFGLCLLCCAVLTGRQPFLMPDDKAITTTRSAPDASDMRPVQP